jgi:hypothetical protein
MVAALVFLLFVLIPSVTWGQPEQAPPPGTPPSSTTDFNLREFNPRTPPPQTIPSRPEITFPVAPPRKRPVQLFELHPLIGISEEYTDNFNLTPSNHKSNFRSMLSPGMKVLLDSAFLTGQATYVFSGFYDTAPNELGYFNNFAAGLSWEATPRIRLNVSGDVNQSDEPDQADSLGLRVTRRKFTSSHASVSSDVDIEGITASPYYHFSSFLEKGAPDTTTNSPGVILSTTVYSIHRVTLGYEYLTSRTSSGTAGVGESETQGNQLSGSFSRDVSPWTTLGISGGYAFRTQNQTLLGVDTETKYYRWNALLFGNYGLPGKIELRASAGVSQLSTQGASTFSKAGDPLFSTFNSLSYWFGETKATVTFERGYAETFTSGQDQGVVLTTGGSASVDSPFPFTPWLRGRASIAYHNNDFTGIGGIPGAARTERVFGVGVGLTYQIVQWLSSTLRYDYSRTDSTGIISENRVRIALDAAF